MTVTFEDNAFDEAEAAANAEWRQLSRYEREILDLLLSVQFEGCGRLKRESVRVRCRTIDRCGCIEFEPGAELAERNPSQIVSEADGPELPDGGKVNLMLATRGGHLLWLEFQRSGTNVTFFPPAGEFVAHAV
jgi:hypothetical protein